MIKEESRKIKRTKVFLKDFDKLAKDHHFIEIIEWINGDGVDIILQDNNGVNEFYLSKDQFKALSACIQKIERLNNI